MADGVGGAWLSAMPANHIRFCCRRCWYVTASSTRPALMHSRIVLMRLSLSSKYCMQATFSTLAPSLGKAFKRLQGGPRYAHLLDNFCRGSLQVQASRDHRWRPGRRRLRLHCTKAKPSLDRPACSGDSSTKPYSTVFLLTYWL